jgi:hypothetical protein
MQTICSFFFFLPGNPKPDRISFLCGEAFQINVLTKLDRIIENQQDELSMLRQLVSHNQIADSSLTTDDIVGKTINSKEEFDALNEKLLDRDLRKKMVC